MKKISIIIMAMFALILTACQDKDIEREAMKLSAPDASQITGQLSGDDYIWTWPSQGTEMRVITYRNGTLSSTETVSGNSYTHKDVPTNVPFEYVFKASDGNNISAGVIKAYTREGASSISGVQMSQIDKAGGYDALVEWNKAADASSILLTATNGLRTINETLSGSATSYIISDVETGDTWEVKLVAQNEKGTSLSTKSSLRIGKTAIGFLSIYGTPEELVENGDDDEASAWLWLHETYPTAQYVCFDDIKSIDDVEPFRVLFWLRDLEGVSESDVWNIPANVEAATPFIREWYKNGGSMLLWSHATVYAGHLGRINLDEMKGNDHAFGFGEGGINEDTWRMAVELNPDHKFKKDHSTHPIYKGLEVETTADTKLRAYIAQGEILPVATRSFGSIGIFGIKNMSRFYRHVLIEKHYPHHAAVMFDHAGKYLWEVLKYMGIPVEEIDYNFPKGDFYPTENPFA